MGVKQNKINFIQPAKHPCSSAEPWSPQSCELSHSSVLCSPLHPREQRGCPCPPLVPGQPGGRSARDPLHLCPPQVLQDGRFSVVWQGTLHQTPVAIKAFPDACSQHFAAEWSVHSLPLMNHDNVARLLAPGSVCLQGSLRHFLSQHISAWDGTVRLALSLARGLAFLHEELWHNGLHKPSVAHRDLSSQNVLVREDRSCAIGDFGLAIALPAGLDPVHGNTLGNLGTQRYMAPEILDDSLDLQDWGRALKQADIYSLALVLWEILTRCSGFSPGERTIQPLESLKPIISLPPSVPAPPMHYQIKPLSLPPSTDKSNAGNAATWWRF
uniref:receptor protein serine/threonine kinase n=1 Tax=Chelydra serpentina TaxID=8475 RepID=A0A8C3S6P6_CHESE